MVRGWWSWLSPAAVSKSIPNDAGAPEDSEVAAEEGHAEPERLGEGRGVGLPGAEHAEDGQARRTGEGGVEVFEGSAVRRVHIGRTRASARV